MRLHGSMGAVAAVLLAWAALVPGCASPSSGMDGEQDLIAEPPAAAASRQLARRMRGKYLYGEACAPCHGLHGDGNGAGAEALEPKPRDFTRGVYKWRSTASGSLPLDRDLFRTISRGVPGTRMAAWEDLLSEEDRWSVVEYIKTFSSSFEEEGVEEDEIVDIPPEIPAGEATIAWGREIYEESKCWECHGRDGRGEGPVSGTLEDNWGRPIEAFDFTLARYRCGGTDRDIYRVLFTGLSGTPMPDYSSIIAENDRWPLVHYVRSLERSPSFLEWILFDDP